VLKYEVGTVKDGTINEHPLSEYYNHGLNVFIELAREM